MSGDFCEATSTLNIMILAQTTLTTWASIALILFLMVMARFVFVSVRFLTRKCSPSMVNEVIPFPLSGPLMLGAFRSIAWSGVAPTSVMLLFVALSQGSSWDALSFFDKEYDVLRPPAERAKVAVRPQGTPGTLVSSSTADRPAWTQPQQGSTSSDVTQVVLSSRLWSTAREADDELQVKAAELLRSDFDQRHHRWLDPKAVHCLNESHIMEAAVKNRFLEQVDQNFGNFSSSMNRLWWQVEISPIVRTELYADWKRALVQNRVLALGTLLAFATMAFNAWGMLAALQGLSHSRQLQFFGLIAGSSAVAIWGCGLLYLVATLMK